MLHPHPLDGRLSAVAQAVAGDWDDTECQKAKTAEYEADDWV